MADTYWYKQTSQKPLFEDLLWSRPENKRQAGKLLIVGGNLHGFAAPAAAYAAAEQAGIGVARILLPDKLEKTVGRMIAEAEFAPSTPSGSFSKKALAALTDNAAWADAVLLAGDFGRNSETAILLDSFMTKHKGQIIVAGDGLDYFLGKSSPLISRIDTTSVINLGKLQKLAKNNRPSTPVFNRMMLTEIIELLHDWTSGNPGELVTKHLENFIVASGGSVSSIPAPEESNWQIELGAYASVWRLQNTQAAFKALTTAVFDMQTSTGGEAI